jgi:hypothetical protein
LEGVKGVKRERERERESEKGKQRETENKSAGDFIYAPMPPGMYENRKNRWF